MFCAGKSLVHFGWMKDKTRIKYPCLWQISSSPHSLTTFFLSMGRLLQWASEISLAHCSSLPILRKNVVSEWGDELICQRHGYLILVLSFIQPKWTNDLPAQNMFHLLQSSFRNVKNRYSDREIPLQRNSQLRGKEILEEMLSQLQSQHTLAVEVGW